MGAWSDRPSSAGCQGAREHMDPGSVDDARPAPRPAEPRPTASPYPPESQHPAVGNGIRHEEYDHPEPRGVFALQLWLQLPPERENAATSYQVEDVEHRPVVEIGRASCRERV